MRTLKRHVPLVTLIALVLAGSVPLAQQYATSAPAGAPAAQAAASVPQAGGITTPKEEWGHNIGDDYFLANYQQLLAYWKKLDAQSDRMQLVEIGQTSLKRPHVMAIITAPANFARLDRYKEISRRLSLAEGLTDDQARELAKEGKAVVWIDGGLHASEVLGAQQLMELVYQMVSRNDEETLRFLNDVILLAAHANPDGHDLLADQYMKYGGGGTPVLYNHYAGHDNNRDSFMNALPETTNISRVMYREWFPQIMYNHHQTGPSGAVMFAPPFRDPFNYNFHPLIAAATDLIGAIMQTRFLEEGKPGVVNTNGASYSTWWNGGLRTTAYFHNQIGILTETIGNPTPTNIPFSTRFAVPTKSWYWQIPPQRWHFRQSIDYSMTANRAVLDFASKYREVNNFRIYRMGKDAIEWGSQDHWTFTPHEIAKIQASLQPEAPAGGGRGAGGGGGRGGGGRGGGGNADAIYKELRSPERRNPRGFILSADSPDFGTSVRFVNALIKSGVAVHKATASFTVNGKQYPANSLIVKTAQAFRPHVMDMFEPQDHPDDIPYPGAAPTAPYDVAGWTLAYTMGVQFDRVLDAFDGPFEKLSDFATVPAGTIRGPQQAAGYYFSHKSNDSFIAINRLVGAGEDVFWLTNGPMGAGTFYVAAKPSTRALLQKAATDLGVSFEAANAAPTGAMSKLRKLRIGLYDQFGGQMPSGWTRLLFENFEFPFEVVFPPDLDAGNLRAKYDVLVFNDGGLSAPGGGGRGGGGDTPAAGGGRGAGGAAGGDPAGGQGAAGQRGGGGGRGGGGRGGGAAQQRDPADDRPAPVPLPAEFERRRGSVTAKTLASIEQFVREGGTVIAIGGAANGAISLFKLPLRPHVTAGREKFYVPGSVLRVAVDPKNPVAHGYENEVDIFFDASPVWTIDKSAAGAADVRPVAWYNSAEPLRSGWAWGQALLDKGVQMAETRVDKGRVFLFGNELLFRTQPHGNYRFFFNALYLSVTPEMK